MSQSQLGSKYTRYWVPGRGTMPPAHRPRRPQNRDRDIAPHDGDSRPGRHALAHQIIALSAGGLIRHACVQNGLIFRRERSFLPRNWRLVWNKGTAAEPRPFTRPVRYFELSGVWASATMVEKAIASAEPAPAVKDRG
jgi:hypothetical protein